MKAEYERRELVKEQERHLLIFCVQLLLGIGYLALGCIEINDLTGFFFKFSLLPGLFFAGAGKVEKYERPIDEILVFVPLLALAGEVVLFFAKFVALWMHMGLVPDLIVYWLTAWAVLRRCGTQKFHPALI